MNTKPEVSIIVPAYNEVAGIGVAIDEIYEVMDKAGIPFEVIVVDDGSDDGTSEQALEKRAVVLRHEENRGYGASLKHGIRQAKAELVAITDADGTYPSDRLPELIALIDGCDMTVGARTGRHVHISLIRRPAKWLIGRLASYLAGVKIPDLNSGLRVMRKSVVERFLSILPNGFSFTTTITLAMLTNDFEVRFIPIDYHKRTGRSKIRPLRDTLKFAQLIVRTVMYFNPLKVFLPFSLFLFGASFSVLSYSYFFTPQIMDVTTIVLASSGLQLLAIGLIADLVDKRSR